MEKDSVYVKIWNRNVKNCGVIDCGCEIIKVKDPHITLKLCKIHGKQEIKSHNTIFKHMHISPMLYNPEKFEAVHLAAVGSKVFD